MKKTLAIIFFGILLFYFIGPTPNTPEYNSDLPAIPSISEVENYVENKESTFDIKPGNKAEIVWVDTSNKTQTDVAIVYLHGFTASPEEGSPIHREIAKRFGCNLYLARLSEHGLDTEEALLNFTAEGLWESAKEAYAIGKRLGKQVIIMSTSTGGTLALKLAATHPEIKGLINYSPNIEINDPAAFLLNDPWGLQIARLVFKGDYRTVESDEDYRKYWYDKYRLESIVQLQELVETAASERTFKNVTCPVFNGVYYKDENHQDNTVRVDAIRRMHEELGTTGDQKQLIEFPDAGGHVIAYGKQSGAVDGVRKATIEFLEQKVGLSQNPGSRENSKRD